MGVDTEIYSVVCSQILNIDPLPTVNKAFAMINQQARSHLVLNRDERMEVVAFFVNFGAGRNFGDKFVCTFCQEKGHVEETCWQLNGYQTRPSIGETQGKTSDQAQIGNRRDRA